MDLTCEGEFWTQLARFSLNVETFRRVLDSTGEGEYSPSLELHQGDGLPKVSPGLSMPNPSTPCGRATPEMALQLFFGGSPPAGQAACGHLLPL
jgi:hypothetical protein